MTRKHKNYSLFNSYSYYTPGVSGMFILLGWLLVGVLFGGLVTSLLKFIIPGDEIMKYALFISYPLQFIPAMMYASFKSKQNACFDKGIKLDNSHFGKNNIGFLITLLIMATLSAAFMVDSINSLMPPMPQYLEELFEGISKTPMIINIITMAIFAPLFEEWLCRGIVLRGLLHSRCKNGKKMNPMTAVIISAAFFAVIHMNPWQAIPAFILGTLFGYVYYKTGSLKLTMLMHAANNFTALMLMKFLPDSSSETYWIDLINPIAYTLIFIICLLIIGVTIKELQKIYLEHSEGNLDVIEPIENNF